MASEDKQKKLFLSTDADEKNNLMLCLCVCSTDLLVWKRWNAALFRLRLF